MLKLRERRILFGMSYCTVDRYMLDTGSFTRKKERGGKIPKSCKLLPGPDGTHVQRGFPKPCRLLTAYSRGFLHCHVDDTWSVSGRKAIGLTISSAIMLRFGAGV